MDTYPLTRRALVAAGLAGLSGCSLLPEEPEPVQASASEPAYIPASAASDAGYAETVASETTIEPTVEVDLSGDVEISNSRKVIATVFRRGYAAEDGRRFGLVTAPVVTVFENLEVIRDPVTALEPPQVVELATDVTVEGISDWTSTGSRTVLGTDATLETATATGDSGEVTLGRLRVRAGEDSVTAVAVAPEGVDGDAPFDAVARDG